jgi:hypothetical protein
MSLKFFCNFVLQIGLMGVHFYQKWLFSPSPQFFLGHCKTFWPNRNMYLSQSAHEKICTKGIRAGVRVASAIKSFCNTGAFCNTRSTIVSNAPSHITTTLNLGAPINYVLPLIPNAIFSDYLGLRMSCNTKVSDHFGCP